MDQAEATTADNSRLALIKAVLHARHDESRGAKAIDPLKLTTYAVNLHYATCLMCQEHVRHLKTTNFQPTLPYPLGIIRQVEVLERRQSVVASGAIVAT